MSGVRASYRPTRATRPSIHRCLRTPAYAVRDPHAAISTSMRSVSGPTSTPPSPPPSPPTREEGLPAHDSLGGGAPSTEAPLPCPTPLPTEGTPSSTAGVVLEHTGVSTPPSSSPTAAAVTAVAAEAPKDAAATTARPAATGEAVKAAPTVEPTKDPAAATEAEAEAEEGEEEEDVPLEAPSQAPTTEKARQRQQTKMLRAARATLQCRELLSPDNIHKYVYLTEVSTPAGVRWIDVFAKPTLWENSTLAKQPEADFVACVMQSMKDQSLPEGMYDSLVSSGLLPSVHIHENWIAFTLRTAMGGSIGGFDPYNNVLALSALSSGASGGGSGAAAAVTRHTSDRGGPLATPASAARLHPPHERPWRTHASSTAATGETAAHPHPHPHPHPRTDDGDGTAYLDDPALRYHYDEDTNQFVPLPVGPPASSTGFLSRLLHRRATGERAGHTHSPRRPRRGRFFRKTRASHERGTSVTAPTMTEETERLTVLLLKEVHPMEEEDHGRPFSSETVTSATRLGLVETDAFGNEVVHARASTAGGAPAADSTAERRPQPPPSLKKSRADPAASLRLRWIVVTVHREPIPAVQEVLIRWQEFVMLGGRLASDDVVGGGGPVRGYTHRVEVGWEHIVAHLFKSAVRGLQQASVSETRLLEVAEAAVFDERVRSSERMRRMRGMLAELHVLSRRAGMYTDILNETSIAYRKLKKTMDSPLSSGDRKALAFLENTVTLSRSVEEQADSLLFLQFSVAMNQMETHLRTLTIFSTFFTPLNFIVGYFSMQFDSFDEYSEDDGSLYSVLALLLVAALTTLHWISRNVK